ncbi:hypothetical protein [Thioclava sp.]|uniref:hypothetical protein n=1 Tax=Thioclava sp. TaxID=1933450 RepID=UPI003AA7FEA6
MSERAAALHFSVSRASAKKMMRFSVPPGYQRTTAKKRPKLDAFTGFIDQWLQEYLSRNRKQQHTAKRIIERLRAGAGVCPQWSRQTRKAGDWNASSPAFYLPTGSIAPNVDMPCSLVPRVSDGVISRFAGHAVLPLQPRENFAIEPHCINTP